MDSASIRSFPCLKWLLSVKSHRMPDTPRAVLFVQRVNNRIALEDMTAMKPFKTNKSSILNSPDFLFSLFRIARHFLVKTRTI